MKHSLSIIYILIMLMVLTTAAYAEDIDPDIDAKAQSIYKEVTCPVCDGQSLSGSQAELARAMRADIRDKIARGMSREEILEDLARRYGDKILMAPPVREDTALLWIAPILALIAGAFFVFRMMRRA